MNIIEFSTREDYLAAEEDRPIPCKLNIPEWFKKLEHKHPNRTVKGCIPFLDTLTSGYLLKLPQDINIKFNVEVINTETKENKTDSFVDYPLRGSFKEFNFGSQCEINLNFDQTHVQPSHQLLGSPMLQKHCNYAVPKILNPWIIKTPPGYSCLLLPPLNNTDDRFSIIPGIVDTDTYENYINFPYIINGDKYKRLDCIVKKGTPYVQIIPFKKENWKMKLTKIDKQKRFDTILKLKTKFLNSYKEFFWNKKIWQ